MLEYIRNKAKGWLAYVMVAIICVPFALWGIGDYLGAGKPPIAAEINDEEITEYQLDQVFQRQKSQQTENFSDDSLAKKQLLQTLIEEKLLLQYSDKLGLRASDAYIATVLRSQPAFKVNGEYSIDNIKQVLRSHGLTFDNYIAQLKDSILKEQLTSLFIDTSIVTENEIQQLFKQINQSRDIKYLVIDNERFTSDITYNDDAVQDFYQQHQENYRTPEKVSVNYIELSDKSLPPALLEVTEEEVRQHYDANIATYTASEKRQLAHILLSKKPTITDEITQTYELIQQKLAEGQSFSELAKIYSDDISSKGDGGMLGWFYPDELPDASFAQHAFALNNINEISKPITSENGVHIIKLLDKQGGQVQTLEEVFNDIKTELANNKADAILFDKKEKLAELIYETPDSLEAASIELGVPVNTSSLMTKQQGVGVFDSRPVLNQIFSDEIILEKYNSDVIELADNHYIAFRVNQHIPSNIPAFDAIKTQVEKDLKTKLLKEKAKAFTADLIAKLNQHDASDSQSNASVMTQIATQHNLEWQSKEKVRKGMIKIPAQVIQKAFTMPVKVDGRLFDSVELFDNKFAVVTVTHIHEPDIATLKTEEKSLYNSLLNASRTQLELELAVKTLREKADIYVKPEYEQQTNDAG